MLGISYSVIGVLSIVIHIIINKDTLFLKRDNRTSKVATNYHNFLWAILLYYITDSLWGILDELHLINALRVDTIVYYLAMSLAVVFWTNYDVAYLKKDDIFGKAIKYFGILFLVFTVVTLIINQFYPLFFMFDEGGVYHAGPIRYFVLYVQISLFLLSCVQTLFVASRSGGEKRRRHLCISLVALSMSAAIIIQIYNPFLPVYSIGYLVGSCFLRIFVWEDEKDENYKNLQRGMDIVSSMAGIFFCSYSIDMENRTYIVIDNKIRENINIIGDSGSTKDGIEKTLKQLILPEYQKEVEEFMNLDTLDERLSEKKYYVSIPFKSVHIGWAEGYFITGDRDENDKLKHVIWAIRTINDEKAKEEKLLYNSYIDELTGLYNRKMYAEDVEIDKGLEDGARAVDVRRNDFIFISMDVNGLKVINDSKGHAAGDELLKGAAYCMKECLGPYGRVYRTGGDEFIAMINASSEQFEQIKKKFDDITQNYQGVFVDSISVSYGYVSREEYPDLSMLEIQKLADKNMYLVKHLYYSSKGVDRRGQQQNAYKALCALYNKILMINLTEGKYSIISMDETEQTEDKGFSDGIFEWLENFAKSGQVHPEDQEEYLSKTNKAFLTEYFKQDKTSLSFTYRRKTNGEFKLSEMEIIPTDSYSDDNQNLFLYVKNIDK